MPRSRRSRPARCTPRLSILHLERRDVPAAGPLGPLQPPALGPITYTTDAAGIPQLTGSTTARTAIYLDFNGHVGNGLDYGPYDTDGNETTFNATEQGVIVELWRQISVYYSMFDVNVTTIQPAVSTPTVWQLLSNDISGGFAYVGAYPNSYPRGFNQSGDARTRHSGIAHEVGHNIGLSHQSDFNLLGVETADYSSGYDSLHGPIMGVDYAGVVHKFIMGHTSNASGLQDDIAIIANEIRTTPTAQGDGFRPDDHGGDVDTATEGQDIDGVLYGWGVIERMSDVDAFTFTVTDGAYVVAADPNSPSGLDVKVEVYGPSGELLAAGDGTTNNQTLTLTLGAGTYTALLSSHGDYGDLGAYFFTVRGLPDGWDTRNIGSVGNTGYGGYDAVADTFAVGGSGADIGGSADNFRFVFQPLTGDGEIIARVASLENTNSAAEAGVMIRESLSNGSRHAFMGVTPTSGTQFLRRTSTGGTTTTSTSSTGAAPYWVRLTRVGNTLTGYRSADGVSWTQVGSATVTMSAAVYVGLAVSSHTNGQANPLADSAFDNVTVTGSVGTPAPVFNDLFAPTGLALSLATGNGVGLTWEAVDGANGYGIDRSPDGINWTLISTVGQSTTSFTDANPGGSQRYFYRVHSRDAAGTPSVPSVVESIVNRPSGPTNLEITSYRTNQLVLDWRDVSGDAGYRIEQSPDGATWTQIATVGTNVPSYTNTGLSTFTQYYYRVTPMTANGDGVPSAVGSRYTRLPAVTGFAVASTTATSINLTWTAVAGATSYRIERSTDNVTFATVTSSATGTSYTNTGLTSLTEYYYRIVGLGGGTESVSTATGFGATQAASTIPLPWATADIGSVGGIGAAGLSGSTFRLIGSGSTIGGSADGFRFVYQPLTGDGTITARVATQDNTAGGARTGVMIRESLAAGSKSALMSITPTSGALFIRRTSTGGSSTTTTTASLTAPYWVRLTRVGNTLTGYVSPDGVTWTEAGTATVSMTANVFVGLAVSSADNTELNTSALDSVTVTRTTPPTQVQSVVVNDGVDQRSQVRSITVTFGSLVTLPTNRPDAFRLTRVGGGDVTLTVDLSQSTATQTIARLTFSGALTENGSLIDGRYELTVRGAQVFNGYGLLDGDADGTAGGDYVSPADVAGGTGLRLYRLFGDATGNGVVDLLDLGELRNTFNASVGDPAYLAYLDADNNGVVDLVDLSTFRSRFNQSVFP